MHLQKYINIKWCQHISFGIVVHINLHKQMNMKLGPHIGFGIAVRNNEIEVVSLYWFWYCCTLRSMSNWNRPLYFPVGTGHSCLRPKIIDAQGKDNNLSIVKPYLPTI